jgi:lipopolysaccharide biosynthesis glycosyltransferase
MTKKVLTVIADKNYLDHARYILSSAKYDGHWDGDYLFIANNINEPLNDFSKFGADILHIKEKNFFYANYYICHPSLQKWDYIVSLDCDFTILGDLNQIFKFDMSEPKIYVDKEPFLISAYFCQNWNEPEKSIALDEIRKEHYIDKLGFNAGFIGLNTTLIKDHTLQTLLDLTSKWQKYNNHTNPNGSDQPIFNIHFNNDIKYIEDNGVAYWRKATDQTIAQHHCRWDAPWNNDEFSSRLGMTYRQNYNRNLKRFYL